MVFVRVHLKTWDPMAPFAAGSYANFETRRDAEVFARVYPGPTGERVRRLWEAYDPDAVLRPLASGS